MDAYLVAQTVFEMAALLERMTAATKDHSTVEKTVDVKVE